MKLLEASPSFDRANDSQLQDRPASGQGRAHQQQWQCLYDNVFKNGKKTHVSATGDICERNKSADTKVSEEGGRGGTPGARTEIPLKPVVKTIVR